VTGLGVTKFVRVKDINLVTLKCAAQVGLGYTAKAASAVQIKSHFECAT